MRRPWPTLVEYDHAVQNPSWAFEDLELSAGQTERNALGLPFARSGGCATVYKLICANRAWAVRCFQRECADLQERYKAISRHLIQSKCTYTVGFDFLPKGIRLGVEWFPAVKMEWVQGDTLDKYVKSNLGSPHKLRSLGEAILQMVRQLQGAGIAHGDLQHGNVLVVQDQPRLVDYDGVYVPALGGRESSELGHRNYQHPGRNKSHFGVELDNFSVWVIYLSLLGLSVEPDLWQAFQRGGECLLFREEDFKIPGGSDVLRALKASPDSLVQFSAMKFESLLRQAPLRVPLPDSRLTPRRAPTSASQPGSSWIRDHSVGASGATGPDWFKGLAQASATSGGSVQSPRSGRGHSQIPSSLPVLAVLFTSAALLTAGLIAALVILPPWPPRADATTDTPNRQLSTPPVSPSPVASEPDAPLDQPPSSQPALQPSGPFIGIVKMGSALRPPGKPVGGQDAVNVKRGSDPQPQDKPVDEQDAMNDKRGSDPQPQGKPVDRRGQEMRRAALMLRQALDMMLDPQEEPRGRKLLYELQIRYPGTPAAEEAGKVLGPK